MSTLDALTIPEAQEWLKDFLLELANFPINQKLKSMIEEYCRQEGSSKTKFLYGICYMVALSSLTPYQIQQETGIPIKTVKLLVNNLNNMMRKLDRLGEKYLHTMYDRFPESYENDFSSIVHVTRYFNQGFDLISELEDT